MRVTRRGQIAGVCTCVCPGIWPPAQLLPEAVRVPRLRTPLSVPCRSVGGERGRRRAPRQAHHPLFLCPSHGRRRTLISSGLLGCCCWTVRSGCLSQRLGARGTHAGQPLTGAPSLSLRHRGIARRATVPSSSPSRPEMSIDMSLIDIPFKNEDSSGPGSRIDCSNGWPRRTDRLS